MTYLDYLNDFNRWIETDNPTDKVIILYYGLLDTFNRHGWPEWTGVDTRHLMMLVRTSNKNVAFRARDALVNAGFLFYKSGKRGRATLYSLSICGSTSDTASVTCISSVTKCDTKRDTESGTCRDTEIGTPHNKTKKKTKKDPPIPPNAAELGFGPELTEAFQDWLAYKQERREMYKPTGLKNLIAQVRKHAELYGESAVAELIRACMASNWRGIIWDRLEKPPEKKRDRYLYDYENTEGSW